MTTLLQEHDAIYSEWNRLPDDSRLSKEAQLEEALDDLEFYVKNFLPHSRDLKRLSSALRDVETLKFNCAIALDRVEHAQPWMQTHIASEPRPSKARHSVPPPTTEDFLL